MSMFYLTCVADILHLSILYKGKNTDNKFYMRQYALT